MRLYKDENGRTLYPVCNWNNNQHKLYNAHDRIMIDIYEAREAGTDTQEIYDRQEEIEHLLDVFNAYVVGGIAYATYEDSVKIKDIVAAYDARE